MFSFTTISKIKLILYKNFNQLVTFTVLEKNEVPLNANALLTDSTLAKVMKADLKEKYYMSLSCIRKPQYIDGTHHGINWDRIAE